MKNILIIITFTLMFGCQLIDDPVSPKDEIIPIAKGVYIVNEGNYGKGNSSLSYYIPDSLKVYQDVYGNANDNKKLGDTGNDIVIFENKAFIVVNNSHKIEVIQTTTHKSVGSIQFTGNKSPYKIAIANSSKAYVTNLYDNSVTSFNPTTLQIIKERISVGKNPQSLLVNGNKLYVCNSGWGSDSTVSIIDISKDSVIKTLTIGDQPSGIGIDADGEIIVKFDGKMDFTNPSKDTEGGVAIINPSTDEIKSKTKLSLSTYGHGEKFISTKKNYALLQTNIGIIKYNTITNIFESTSFINTSQFSVNRIFVDEANELIYISDAKDYTNAGEIHIYKNDGSKIGSYKTGIIPGSIAFVR